MDIVETVATEIADIPGNPSSLEIARIAIEAYQRALWTPHFETTRPIYPEHRRARANRITSHIMSIVGKYVCDHGDAHGCRDASRELFEAIYEAGVEIITESDRASAGLSPRDAYGLTREDIQILDARYRQAMLGTMPHLILHVNSVE